MAHYLDKDGLLRFFQGLKNVFAAKNHSHTTVNGHTVNADVPSGAKFTDTVYTHPSYTSKSSGLYKVSVDSTGHISAATAVAKSDITGLGIPAQDTTYSAASQSAAGLMSAADKKKLDGIAAGAQVNTVTGVKGNSESSYRTGNVNLTAANIGAAAASHTHSPDQLTAGYIRNAVYISHHPEGTGKATFPFLYNDLAHLVRRGGAYTVYTTTATDYTPGTLASTAVSIDLTNAFDGSPSYIGPNRAQTDRLVIDITCPQMFTYSNVFYLDFGSDSWRAKSINVLVMNSNTETKYTQKAAVTNWAWGHYQVPGLSHTSTNTSGTTVQGFNRLRIVLTDFANTQNRIAQIGIINYGSAGVRVPYMSRGVDDDVYRSIHPATSGTYSLGTSSKKWADGYFTTLYGSGANLTSLNGSNISSGTVAAARIASLDASKIGSGTFDAARLPAASTTAQGAMSADDKVKLNGIAAGAQVNTITGVKGNAESSYRTGNVNLTAANIGAAAAIHSHAASDISSGTLDAARIPSLDASKIGSGTLAAARLPAMTGATASAAGTQGAVPAPAAGKQAQFLRGDGTWATPTDTNTDTKVNVTLATTTKAFLLGTSTTPTSSAQAVTALADTGVYLDTTAGKLTATSFAGNGASLTSLNGSNISSGTVAAARIASLDASKITSGAFAAARLEAAIPIRIELSNVSLTLNSSTNLYEYTVSDSRILESHFPKLSIQLLATVLDTVTAETSAGKLTLSCPTAQSGLTGLVILEPTRT